MSEIDEGDHRDEMERADMALDDVTRERDELAVMLSTVLDQVDYTVGACALTTMVGAALDAKLIERARALLAKAKP